MADKERLEEIKKMDVRWLMHSRIKNDWEWLIEQAERLDKIDFLYSDCNSRVAGMNYKIEELEREIKRLRGVLGFYANVGRKAKQTLEGESP